MSCLELCQRGFSAEGPGERLRSENDIKEYLTEGYPLSYGASRVGRVEFGECFHVFKSFIIHTVAGERD